MSIARSLLAELCEEGQQMVKLTRLLRKNSEMMFPEENAISTHIDDYVTPPAPKDTFVTWATRYLVERNEDD